MFLKFVFGQNAVYEICKILYDREDFGLHLEGCFLGISISDVRGLSNNIFFATVASLLGISGVAGKITIDAGSQLMATGTYEGNIVLPVLSSLFSLLSLSIIAFGAAIAPKPPPTEDVENELI